MNEDYVAGFMAKAAELGVDPEALVKQGALTPMIYQRAKKLSKLRTPDVLKRDRQALVAQKNTIWNRLTNVGRHRAKAPEKDMLNTSYQRVIDDISAHSHAIDYAQSAMPGPKIGGGSI